MNKIIATFTAPDVPSNFFFLIPVTVLGIIPETRWYALTIFVLMIGSLIGHIYRRPRAWAVDIFAIMVPFVYLIGERATLDQTGIVGAFVALYLIMAVVENNQFNDQAFALIGVLAVIAFYQQPETPWLSLVIFLVVPVIKFATPDKHNHWVVHVAGAMGFLAFKLSAILGAFA